MDVFSPAKRSEIMRRVRSKGTTPELLVRKVVTRVGFRYRLNSKTLPGHPDLVFSRLRRLICPRMGKAILIESIDHGWIELTAT